MAHEDKQTANTPTSASINTYSCLDCPACLCHTQEQNGFRGRLRGLHRWGAFPWPSTSSGRKGAHASARIAMAEAAESVMLAQLMRVGTKMADQCCQRLCVACPQIGNRPLTRPLLAPSSPHSRVPCAHPLYGPIPRVFGRVACAWRPHFKPRGVYNLLDVSTVK